MPDVKKTSLLDLFNKGSNEKCRERVEKSSFPKEKTLFCFSKEAVKPGLFYSNCSKVSHKTARRKPEKSEISGPSWCTPSVYTPPCTPPSCRHHRVHTGEYEPSGGMCTFRCSSGRIRWFQDPAFLGQNGARHLSVALPQGPNNLCMPGKTEVTLQIREILRPD